jgi:hypothetical protein
MYTPTMTTATLPLDSIKQLACPNCGTAMRLFGIEDEKPGYELHSFECRVCRHIGADVVKIPFAQ